MAFTRNAVAKGAGAIILRRLADDRVLYLNTNSKYALNKDTTDGSKVQGFNSDGKLVDLDVAGQEESYTLEISSKKNTRNINEIALDSIYITQSTYNAPWGETATVSSGIITLKGGTPASGTLVVTYLDGTKLTSSVSAPTVGQFKDNGDGTVTINTADNGKTLALLYKTSVANVSTQGGSDHTPMGYVDVMFHQVSGTSSTSGKQGVDILWLPKCSISGNATFEFSNDVQDKTFKLTGLIPDVPAGFKVPYLFVRDVEMNNTNAG